MFLLLVFVMSLLWFSNKDFDCYMLEFMGYTAAAYIPLSGFGHQVL